MTIKELKESLINFDDDIEVRVGDLSDDSDEVLTLNEILGVELLKADNNIMSTVNSRYPVKIKL